MGVIMGTAAYMSTEQVRGKTVDKRADIWAFGAVLFEMLTGQRAFEGEDASVTLSAVIEREPTWDLLPPALPPVQSSYLRRCLKKDPRQRVRDIGDVRLALDGGFEAARGPAPSAPDERRSSLRRPLYALVAGIALGVGLATAAFWGAIPPTQSHVTRLGLTLDDMRRECPTGSRKSAATVNTSYPTFCISAMLSSSRSRCAFSIQRCS